jgi:hypothetical protein
MNSLLDTSEVAKELERIKREVLEQFEKVSVWQMFFSSTPAHRRAALLALAIPSSATMSGSYVSASPGKYDNHS